MIRNILVAVSLLVFSNCSPKIAANIKNKQAPLPDSSFVLVLQKNDPFTNDGVEIGTVRSGEKGMSAHCSYPEVIVKLKQLARTNGANLIKIVEYKDPDNWSSCVRLTGKIYKVPNFKVHEREIEWSANRKLDWQDFKAKARDSMFVAAQTAAGFSYDIRYNNVFGKTNIIVRTYFDCDLSWVRADQKYRADLLEHEQSHFDLCELYARQLKKRLTELKLPSGKLIREANVILKEVYRSYLDRQYLYDSETNHSLNREKQVEWTALINKELNELQGYSTN